MTSPTPVLGPRPRAVAYAALTFVLGIEMVRFHIGSLAWYQRDTVGVGALDLIPIAVIPFAAGLVLPIASRVLSLRTTLWVGTGLLLVARVLTQVAADPAVTHWTSGVAVAAFVGLLVLQMGLGREVLVGGVLLGIAADAAIKAQGVTLDLVHRPRVAPLVAVLLIAAGIAHLLRTAEIGTRTGPGWLPALTLIGVGPLLFVQYLVLQSAGWISARTGLGTVWVGLAIVVLDLAALWLASRLDRSPVAVGLAAVVVASAAATAEGSPWLFAILLVVAIPLAGPLWAALVPEAGGTSLAPAAVAIVVGSVVFLVIGFAYYLPLDLHLGFSQAQARLAGAGLVAVVGVVSARRRRVGEPLPVTRRAAALTATLLVLPLAAVLGGGTLPPAAAEPPLRVMSFNIHQAFGTAGDMDVDAVADVIRDSGATVVGLQEIPRGGLLNAGADLLALLGDRLGWEHRAYFGTTDPVWGNAILSRYPLREIDRTYLPTVGTPFRRGYLAATVDSPIGEILFASVHLQHVNDPDVAEVDPEGDLYAVHTAQLAVVVDEWAGREPAILVGDLNARPGWRQVEELLAEGWVDAWAEAGDGAGHTANAADPQHRIDYVFHTPDLRTVRVDVVDSQASDHFAVVADLAPSG